MRGSAKARIIVCTGLQILALLSVVGCEQQKSAISLYVDAVTLREAGKINASIKKLNEAVAVDEDFSLGYSMLCKIHQDMREYEKSASACEMATQFNPWSVAA